MNPHTASAPVGTQLRAWRQRRRLSQLDLSVDADVSTRHLSCVETGRAMPSREMVLRLAERMAVPLRERNRLLTAAGYAPMFAERGLDDPALASARAALDQLLAAHEPFPALAVDRHWNLVAHNAAAALLMGLGVAPELLVPPVNVLRVSLHPRGLAPRIVNLAAWRGHLLERIRHQVASTADPVLAALLAELLGYAAPTPARTHSHSHSRSDSRSNPDAHESTNSAAMPLPASAIVVPLVLDTPAGTLSLISTMTVFGTPVEVTLSELALETFFPADAATADALRRLAADR